MGHCLSSANKASDIGHIFTWLASVAHLISWTDSNHISLPSLWLQSFSWGIVTASERSEKNYQPWIPCCGHILESPGQLLKLPSLDQTVKWLNGHLWRVALGSVFFKSPPDDSDEPAWTENQCSSIASGKLFIYVFKDIPECLQDIWNCAGYLAVNVTKSQALLHSAGERKAMDKKINHIVPDSAVKNIRCDVIERNLEGYLYSQKRLLWKMILGLWKGSYQKIRKRAKGRKIASAKTLGYLAKILKDQHC